MMDKRRVVVTGLGLITPLGLGVETSWQHLINGTSGIKRITGFDASAFPTQIAGEVDNFNPEDYVEIKEVKKMDRFIHFAAGQISIKFSAKGPNSAISTACATGSHSIGDAFRIIQRGEADAMIAGGTEAVISPLGIGGFNAMKALSTRNDEPEKASRPFDVDRGGFVG